MQRAEFGAKAGGGSSDSSPRASNLLDPAAWCADKDAELWHVVGGALHGMGRHRSVWGPQDAPVDVYPVPASSPHQLFTVPAALVVRQGTQLRHLGCQLSGLHCSQVGCVLSSTTATEGASRAEGQQTGTNCLIGVQYSLWI